MRTLKRSLAIVLAIAMVLTTFGMTVVSAASYADTTGHWAESYINSWSDRGVIQGDGGYFRPDDTITRAEVAQVTQNVIGYVDKAANNFSDIDSSAWYADAVLKLVAAGTLNGNGDGTMAPQSFMTREEAMTMLARAYGLTVENSQAAITQYSDYQSVSDYATGYVGAMTAAGYVGGYEDGTIRPGAYISRAEFVKILDNMIKLYITAPGTYGPEYAGGIVMIKSGEVVLNGIVANGMVISPQVGGNVDITNCQVSGNVVNLSKVANVNSNVNVTAPNSTTAPNNVVVSGINGNGGGNSGGPGNTTVKVTFYWGDDYKGTETVNVTKNTKMSTRRVPDPSAKGDDNWNGLWYTSKSSAQSGKGTSFDPTARNISSAMTLYAGRISAVPTDAPATATPAPGQPTATVQPGQPTATAQPGQPTPGINSYKATLNVTGGTGRLESAAVVNAAADDTWAASEAPALGSSVNIGESLVLTFGRAGDKQTVSVKDSNKVLIGVKEQETAFTFKSNQISGNNNGGVIDETNPNKGSLADGTEVEWTRAVAPSINAGVATVPNTGVFYKIDAKNAGSIEIKGKVGSGKAFAFLDATTPKFVTDSKTSIEYNPDTPLTADLTTINADIEANHTYYLVGMGTKMSLESITFTAGGSAPADPTTAPADPTTAPADPTTAPADPTTAPADPTATTAPAAPTDAPNVYTFVEGTTVNYVGEAATAGEVPTVVVTAKDGSNVAVNGTSFVMPSQDVTVTVTYAAPADPTATAAPVETAAPTEGPTIDPNVPEGAIITNAVYGVNSFAPATSNLTDDQIWDTTNATYTANYEALGKPFGELADFATRYTSYYTINSAEPNPLQPIKLYASEAGEYNVNMLLREYRGRGYKVTITKDGETDPTAVLDLTLEANQKRVATMSNGSSSLNIGVASLPVQLEAGTYTLSFENVNASFLFGMNVSSSGVAPSFPTPKPTVEPSATPDVSEPTGTPDATEPTGTPDASEATATPSATPNTDPAISGDAEVAQGSEATYTTANIDGTVTWSVSASANTAAITAGATAPSIDTDGKLTVPFNAPVGEYTITATYDTTKTVTKTVSVTSNMGKYGEAGWVIGQNAAGQTDAANGVTTYEGKDAIWVFRNIRKPVAVPENGELTFDFDAYLTANANQFRLYLESDETAEGTPAAADNKVINQAIKVRSGEILIGNDATAGAVGNNTGAKIGDTVAANGWYHFTVAMNKADNTVTVSVKDSLDAAYGTAVTIPAAAMQSGLSLDALKQIRLIGISATYFANMELTSGGAPVVPTATPSATEKPELTGVTISGTAKVGETLTAVAEPSDTEVTCYWYTADTADTNVQAWSGIDGATGASYVVKEDNVNKYIGVKAFASGYDGIMVVSELYGPITAAEPPVEDTVTVSGAITLTGIYNNADNKKDKHKMTASDLVLEFVPAQGEAIAATLTGVQDGTADSALSYTADLAKDTAYTASLKDTDGNVYEVSTGASVTTGTEASTQAISAVKTYTYQVPVQFDENSYAQLADGTEYSITFNKKNNITPAAIKFTKSDVNAETKLATVIGHNFKAADTDGVSNNWFQASFDASAVHSSLKNFTSNQDAMDATGTTNPVVKFQTINVKLASAPTSVTITGDSREVGSQLGTTLAPEDASASYQWYTAETATAEEAAWTAINGATSATLLLKDDMVGKFIAVKATGTGLTGTVSAIDTTAVTVSSVVKETVGYAEWVFNSSASNLAAGATATVTNNSNPALTQAPILKNYAKVANKTYNYQAISGAKSPIELPLSKSKITYAGAQKGSNGKGCEIDPKLAENGATSYDLYVMFSTNDTTNGTRINLYKDYTPATETADLSGGTEVGTATTCMSNTDPTTAIYTGLNSSVYFNLGGKQGYLWYVGIIYYK